MANSNGRLYEFRIVKRIQGDPESWFKEHLVKIPLRKQKYNYQCRLLEEPFPPPKEYVCKIRYLAVDGHDMGPDVWRTQEKQTFSTYDEARQWAKTKIPNHDGYHYNLKFTINGYE